MSTSLSNYVTSTYLSTYHYTKTYIDSNFQSIAGMSNFVSNSSLTTTLSNYITSTYLTTNYYLNTYIDSTFATIASLNNYYLKTTTLNNITAATGSINANSQKIINLANPTLPNDATNKSYVDANTFSLTLLANNIRVGSIKVGNIGNYNIGSAVTSGCITSGSKSYY